MCSSEARLKRSGLSGFDTVMDSREGLQFPIPSLSFFLKSAPVSGTGEECGFHVSAPFHPLSFFLLSPFNASHLGTLSIQNSSNQRIKTLGISTRVNASVPTLMQRNRPSPIAAGSQI